MPFEVTEYRREDVDNLIDYLLRTAQTEHGMDGAVRHAVNLAERIRAPRFRSIRHKLVGVDLAELEKRALVAPDRVVAPWDSGPGYHAVDPYANVGKIKVTEVEPTGRVLRRWNKVKRVFEFIARE